VIERLLAAEAALDRDELDIAERLFGQVSRADERNAIAVVGLGRVAARRGRHDDARALMERALAIDPDEAAAQRLLAELDAAPAGPPGIIKPEPSDEPSLEAEPAATIEPAPTVEPEVEAAAAIERAPSVEAEVPCEAARAAEAARSVEADIEPAPAPASRRSLLDRILRLLRRKPDDS
jgi:tetratricopeptide (TPR) repeat protein